MNILSPLDESGPGDEALVARAKALYAQRRQRAKAFGAYAGLFHEPAWDILVDLYVAAAENKRVSVSSACLAACVPATTALRWIRCLIERGLVHERVDETDRRRRFLELTPTSEAMMLNYLSALR